MTKEQFDKADILISKIKKLNLTIEAIKKTNVVNFQGTNVCSDKYTVLQEHYFIFKKYCIKSLEKEVQELELQLNNIK